MAKILLNHDKILPLMLCIVYISRIQRSYKSKNRLCTAGKRVTGAINSSLLSMLPYGDGNCI